MNFGDDPLILGSKQKKWITQNCCITLESIAMDWNIGIKWVTFLSTNEYIAFFSLCVIFSNHLTHPVIRTHKYTKARTRKYTWGHSFSTIAKLSEKLTFLTPDTHTLRTPTCAYQGVRNVSFSDNFAYLLNEWFHTLDL